VGESHDPVLFFQVILHVAFYMQHPVQRWIMHQGCISGVFMAVCLTPDAARLSTVCNYLSPMGLSEKNYSSE
jgi:hypothetical protein